MKKKKVTKKSSRPSRKGGYSRQQQTTKERIFQVRRQAQFLTAAEEVRASSYEELKTEAAKAFKIDDPDSFIIRELTTPGKGERDVESISFTQISTDLLITFKDELPLMPGFHTKKSEYGFLWVDSIDPKNDGERNSFYQVKDLLSYPRFTQTSNTTWVKAEAIAYHFRNLITTHFVIYFEKQGTVMCFHPGDFFSQFKKGPLRDITEDEIVLFMKRIETIPEESFWTRINCISKTHSDHGGLQNIEMNKEILDPNYFPEFEVDSLIVAEGVQAIMNKVRDNIPPDFTDEWCRNNIRAFGVRTECGLNWLHLCCAMDNAQWLKFISKYARIVGININNTGGSYALTPLCLAAMRSSIDVVKACVEIGADVNISVSSEYLTSCKYTALHYAAKRNAEDICEYLVSTCQMNVNERTLVEETPLSLTESPAITTFLFAHGAKVSGLVDRNNNNLVRYKDYVPCIELLKIYLAHGGKKIVNVRSGHINTTPLSRLCYTAKLDADETLEAMRMLIEAGADVNSADTYGTTPLLSITRNNENTVQSYIEKYVKLLLDAGAKTNMPPTQTEEVIINNCIVRNDWMSVLHLIEHGAVLTKEQKDSAYSSGCAKLLEKIETNENTKLQKEIKLKDSTQNDTEKKNIIITEMDENASSKIDVKKEEEEAKIENEIKALEGMDDCSEENKDDSYNEERVSSKKEVFEQQEDFYEEDSDNEDCFNREVQEPNEDRPEQKTVPIEMYLKLKKEYEMMIEQVERYARMLVNEEEQTFKASKIVKELEDKINSLNAENKTLKDTISKLEKQNHELQMQQQQQHMPQLQQFPMNNPMDVPFNLGPIPNIGGSLFDYDAPTYFSQK